MIQIQRRNDILRLLNERKELTVKELCGLLYSSPATIRRDLTALEKKGLLTRGFGGAVLNETFSDQVPLLIRSAQRQEEKKAICKKAAKFLRPHETVFLDASSTVFYMVPYLKDIPDLTVVTNNPYLCIKLSEYKIHNFCTGGEMLDNSIALVGDEAVRFVRGIRANAFFFSARGYAGDEITDASKPERDLRIAMLERSDRHYFLCDTSKCGRCYPYLITSLSSVDAVIDESRGDAAR